MCSCNGTFSRSLNALGHFVLFLDILGSLHVILLPNLEQYILCLYAIFVSTRRRHEITGVIVLGTKFAKCLIACVQLKSITTCLDEMNMDKLENF